MVLGNREFEPVPDWLMRDVLDPVLADLQRPHPVDLTLGVEPGTGIVWVWEHGGAGAFGLGLPARSTPRAELLVAWADQLQEQFFPETVGAWGQARPECPGHPHPASAVQHDGEAWWVCPGDGHVVGRIGQLR